MKKLIDKSTVVAEIERKKIPFKKDIENGVYPTYLCALMDFEDFINTLETKEVKEVNLENEFFNWYNEEKNRDYNASILYEKYSTISKKLAKYFFELGLNAQKGK